MSSIEEDGAFVSFADGEVHGAGGAGCEGNDDGLAALALHSQGVMAPLETKITDVAVQRFGDSEPVEGEQAGQSVVSCSRESGLDEERTELVAVQSVNRCLVSKPRSPHIGSRVRGDDLFFGAVPVERRHSGESTCRGCSCCSCEFEGAGEQFDVGTTHTEHRELVVPAPRDVAAQILPVGHESVA